MIAGNIIPMTDDPHGPVPNDVRDLVAFVNTFDLETGEDELSNSARFAAWLKAQDLPTGRATPVELGSARSLRDGLRLVALANTDAIDEASLQSATRTLQLLP